MRLDVYLAQEKMVPSRTNAKDAIQEGRVFVNGNRVNKPSYELGVMDQVVLLPPDNAFASRAGQKLADALDLWQVDLNGKVVVDIGASTGGFSDVCLKRGARHVYAIDSGTGQLVERLRNDERITNMEGINARYLTKAMFKDPIDFICMDVSFISITKILPAIKAIAPSSCEAIFLIKPQFEAGKRYVSKNGVVKDKKIHKQVLRDLFLEFDQYGFALLHVMKATIKGRAGNQEYVAHLSLGEQKVSLEIWMKSLDKIIEA